MNLLIIEFGYGIVILTVIFLLFYAIMRISFWVSWWLFDKNNILCKIKGHKLKYNFTNMPDKCICERCKRKWKWNYDPYSDWVEVEMFDTKVDLGTDEEMIKRWW